MALAEAVGRKEAADAIVATKERRARELSIEIFNLEERAVAVKDELETRSRERLLAKMAKRRSDLEALRETARKGEATMAAVERANESSLLTRMQTRKKDLASRDEKEAAAVREAARGREGRRVSGICSRWGWTRRQTRRRERKRPRRGGSCSS